MRWCRLGTCQKNGKRLEKGHLPWVERNRCVTDLVEYVLWDVDHQGKSSLLHLPLVQVETWHDRHNLPKVALIEVFVDGLLDLRAESVERNGPGVVPLLQKPHVHLKLLEQHHEVVEVSWQGQVQDVFGDHRDDWLIYDSVALTHLRGDKV